MKEINRILIANRGEIALRIIKASRELGITTVAIYSQLDGPDAYFCRMADLSFPLQGTDLTDTYLNIEKIISIAKMPQIQWPPGAVSSVPGGSPAPFPVPLP